MTENSKHVLLNPFILHIKGNTAINGYIIAIAVSVIATLMVTVVCLIFKIRQLTSQQTTRPTKPNKDLPQYHIPDRAC